MKIYKSVTIDIKTGQIIEEDSYEYSGPVAYLKGGSSAPPPPTAEENMLYQEQADLFREQAKQVGLENELIEKLWPYVSDLATMEIESAKEMQPLQAELAKQGIDLQSIAMEAAKEEIGRNKELEAPILETLGYQKDEAGKYVPIPGREPGVSPLLESQLEQQEKELRQGLSTRLGPGYEDTTPGIQAMDKFETRSGLLRGESELSERKFQTGGLLALRGGGGLPTGGGAGVPTGGGSNVLSGLMGGGGGIPDSSGLTAQLKSNRMDPWYAQQGQQAGRTSAMMSGAATGATIGSVVPGVGTAIGAGVGAGVGLLAGYLLS